MRPRLAFAMAPAKTRFVFDDASLARLRGICDVAAEAPLAELDSPAAHSIIHDIEILVTGWGCPFVSRSVVAAAPRLRLIAHAAGTIKYHLDPAVFEAGIIVTNAVDANAVPVAEFTLGAIIFANKRIFEFRDLYREDPARKSSHALMNTPIGNYRRTIGIVGASHIGRRVIRLLAPFDYSILLYDPHVRADDEVAHAAQLTDLDDLMTRSDVVTLHAPSLASTKGMINAHNLGLMRDGATLINTARGALIDEAALIAEVETGRISAVIDVTNPEIPPVDSPLRHLPNVLLTPHIAGAIGTERSRLGNLVVDEIERFVAGEPMLHLVEPDLLQQLA